MMGHSVLTPGSSCEISVGALALKSKSFENLKPSAIKRNFGAKSMILDDFWTKTMPVPAPEGVRGCGFGVLEANYYDK